MKIVALEISHDPENGYSGLIAFRDEQSGRIVTQSVDDTTIRDMLDQWKWHVSTWFNFNVNHNEFIMSSPVTEVTDA